MQYRSGCQDIIRNFPKESFKTCKREQRGTITHRYFSSFICLLTTFIPFFSLSTVNHPLSKSVGKSSVVPVPANCRKISVGHCRQLWPSACRHRHNVKMQGRHRADVNVLSGSQNVRSIRLYIQDKNIKGVVF